MAFAKKTDGHGEPLHGSQSGPVSHRVGNVRRVILRTLADHLGAPRCVGCRRAGGIVCASCRSELRPTADARSLPNVDDVVAAFDYEGIARELVLALKARSRRVAGTALG